MQFKMSKMKLCGQRMSSVFSAEKVCRIGKVISHYCKPVTVYPEGIQELEKQNAGPR